MFHFLMKMMPHLRVFQGMKEGVFFRYYILKLPLSRKHFQLSPIISKYLQEVRIWCSGPMNMMNMNINS